MVGFNKALPKWEKDYIVQDYETSVRNIRLLKLLKTVLSGPFKADISWNSSALVL